MSRRSLIPLCIALGIAACDNPQPTGPRIHPGTTLRPLFVVTEVSASDPGKGPGDERPNSDAAADAFDNAADNLGTLKVEDFEGITAQTFTSLSLDEMIVTVNAGQSALIKDGGNDVILGYNTTGEGTKHLNFTTPSAATPPDAKIEITFRPRTGRLVAWGAYFTGVGTVPNTFVEVAFDDGTETTIPVPGSTSGGVSFVGFTEDEPDKAIESITVRETAGSTSGGDVISIDDVRFVSVGSAATELVPAGEADTVAITDGNGLIVAGIAIPEDGLGDPTQPGGEDVVVTVERVELDPATAERCHAHLVLQTGDCIEINATVAGTGQPAFVQAENVIAGVCELPNDAPDALELYKFSQRNGPFIALEQKPFPCGFPSGSQTGSARPRNWLEGLAMRIIDGAVGLVSPKPLWAKHAGHGGELALNLPLSFFTWASPMQISSARVAVNLLNSGRDAYAATGVFDLGLAPAALTAKTPTWSQDVTVGFGPDHFETILAGSFKYDRKRKRFVYVAPFTRTITTSTPRVRYLAIDPANGSFGILGGAPTPIQSASTSGLSGATLQSSHLASEGSGASVFRSLTLRIGNRGQGAGLFCAAWSRCQLEHSEPSLPHSH